MKRRLMLVALVLLAAGAVGVVVFSLRHGDPVSRSLYEKIQLGMSFEEVQGLIGKPESYIDDQALLERAVQDSIWGPVDDADASESAPGKLTGERIECWYGRAGGITITLDKNDLVVRKGFFLFAQRPFLDRVFAGPGAWFGLQLPRKAS